MQKIGIIITAVFLLIGPLLHAQVPAHVKTNTWLWFVTKARKNGIADTQGRVIIPAQYNDLHPIINKIILYNSQGSQVLDHHLKKICASPYIISTPVANTGMYVIIDRDYRAGLMNSKGLIKGWFPKNQGGYNFLSKIIAIYDQKTKQVSLYDTAMKFLGKQPYEVNSYYPGEEIPGYQETYCVVKDSKTGKYGIGDYFGKLLVPMKYDDIEFMPAFNSRVAQLKLFSDDTTESGINYYHIPQQRFLFKKPFAGGGSYEAYCPDSVARIEENGIWNYYDENGQPVSKLVLAELYNRKNGLGYGRLAGDHGNANIVFNRNDQVLWQSADTALLWPPDYGTDQAVYYLRRKEDYFYGVLNWRTGNIILPANYTEIKITPQPDVFLVNTLPTGPGRELADAHENGFRLVNAGGQPVIPFAVQSSNVKYSKETALILTGNTNPGGKYQYYLYHFATGRYEALPYAGAFFTAMSYIEE